jgi:glycine reductase
MQNPRLCRGLFIQVTNLTKIAEGIGANRILRGNSVLHVFGDPSLPLPSEKAYRQAHVLRALKMLEKVPEDGRQAIIEE